MIARPQPARWVNLLAVSDDLPAALVALATRSPVELEGGAGTSSSSTTPVLTLECANRLQRFESLVQTFQAWWSHTETNTRTSPGPAFALPPLEVLDRALATLEAWRLDAEPLIQSYQEHRARESELMVLADLTTALADGPLDLGLLGRDASSAASFCLKTGVFVLPQETPPMMPQEGLLVRSILGRDHPFVLVVAPAESMPAFTEAMGALNGRPVILPDNWQGRGQEILPGIQQNLSLCRTTIKRVRQELATLGERHDVASHMREVARLQWFFKAVKTVEAGDALSRLGGWVAPDVKESTINHLLDQAGVRALASMADVGPGTPPMVLMNPWWAKPFEFFSRLLGTPGRNEVDASRLLAVVAPLLFGYMFGDMGQGLVLAGIGFYLRKRWDASWLLMTGGVSAFFFGWMFGSVFCIESWVSPLWLHPTLHPLSVLSAPLVLGVFLLLCGMGFNALGARWQGHGWEWLRHDGGVILIYLGLLLAFFSSSGWWLVLVGGGWFVIGTALESLKLLPVRLAHLVETLMQLGVNTLSFSRVGAFALAHAGLSQAVVTLAGLTGGELAGFVILVLGNLLILLLEGLVVSVQTTRLILFEFFVRFLRGEGRPFRPLPPPPE
ncbi:MAG: hypothetical protein H7839_08670 [Magnetococcus sp. YQC-5]